MRRAVFLDRDGVINKVIMKDGRPFSPRSVKEFEFNEDVNEVLTEFREKGFLNIIFTNQPDISRQLMKRATLEKMHSLILNVLPVDDIFVCPHDNSDSCECRKPKPGLLFEAAEKWDVDLEKSYVIGDQYKDVDAGKAAGCTTIIIDYPYNKDASPDYRVETLKSVASIL